MTHQAQDPPPVLPSFPPTGFVAGRGGSARLRAGGLSQAFPGALPQEGFPEL